MVKKAVVEDSSESKVDSGYWVFVCACGCLGFSEPLGKDYMRLPSGGKWYLKGHEPSQGRIFKNGVIVKEGDF